MDGQWRITQYSPASLGGVITHEITVVPIDTDVSVKVSSPTDPFWLHDTILDGPCLGLAWADGREVYYPWASIVKAEYTPPTVEGAVT
jgi:hypothetical protein